MFDKMQCLPLPGGRGEFTWAQGDGVAGINLFEVLFSRGRICFMDIPSNFEFGVVGLINKNYYFLKFIRFVSPLSPC